MTLEVLSLTICLASGIFGRPAWPVEKCDERAAQILKISEANDLDPLMFVAVNIQECDLNESANARFYAKPVEGKKKKPMGVDSCPMGIRIWWPNGRPPEKPLTTLELYELAGRKMARWKHWCAKNHKGHHYIGHWNEGNRTYATQVLGFRAALEGKPVRNEEELTDRSREILKRLHRAQRSPRS
jgi:hypothetical protein